MERHRTSSASLVVAVSSSASVMQKRVRTRLDPEEALARPLYVVAAMLVVIPLVEFLLVVPPAEYSSVQWRFAAAGLLSSHTLLPILGLALAFVISAFLRHHSVQRALVVACLTIAVFLAVVSILFALDARSLRPSVPPAGRPAFSSAWTRALITHVLSAVTLAYLGWRARLMIPVSSRVRGPKNVHVVSK